MSLAHVSLGKVAAWAVSGIAALIFAGSASAALLGLLHLRRSCITPLTLRCAADLVLLVPILCLAR